MSDNSWEELELRTLATMCEPEPDRESYRLFYVVPSGRKNRMRVRSGALVHIHLLEAEQQTVVQKRGLPPRPILTLHAPKTSFLWVNDKNTLGMTTINLVGWKEMTLQDRADHYAALEMEKSLEQEERLPFSTSGTVTGRISTAQPNTMHSLSAMRQRMPKGPARNEVKNVLFGSAYGMHRDAIRALRQK